MSAIQQDQVRTRIGLRAHLLLRGDLLAQVGVLVLTVFAVIAVFGAALPFGDAQAIGAGPRLASPSSEWVAGTDALGRSVLPRVVEGIRTTFLIAGVAVVLTAGLSVAVALVAAYYGGVVDDIITRVADVFFAFPAILLALLVIAVLGPGLTGVVISIALITCPLMIRVVRAAALDVIHRDFVVAAKVGGARSSRILLVHLLPNVAGTAIVQATYALSIGMLLESTLSFLGLGVQPPQASLGSLVYEGAVYLSVAPWLVLIPGAVLALAILAVNLVGDGLRDRLDVRAVEARL